MNRERYDALLSGSSTLTLDMLPWRGADLAYWLFFSALFGLLSLALIAGGVAMAFGGARTSGGDAGRDEVVLDLLVDDAEHHDPQGVDRLPGQRDDGRHRDGEIGAERGDELRDDAGPDRQGQPERNAEQPEARTEPDAKQNVDHQQVEQVAADARGGSPP